MDGFSKWACSVSNFTIELLHWWYINLCGCKLIMKLDGGKNVRNLFSALAIRKQLIWLMEHGGPGTENLFVRTGLQVFHLYAGPTQNLVFDQCPTTTIANRPPPLVKN